MVQLTRCSGLSAATEMGASNSLWLHDFTNSLELEKTIADTDDIDLRCTATGSLRGAHGRAHEKTISTADDMYGVLTSLNESDMLRTDLIRGSSAFCKRGAMSQSQTAQGLVGSFHSAPRTNNVTPSIWKTNSKPSAGDVTNSSAPFFELAAPSTMPQGPTTPTSSRTPTGLAMPTSLAMPTKALIGEDRKRKATTNSTSTRRTRAKLAEDEDEYRPDSVQRKDDASEEEDDTDSDGAGTAMDGGRPIAVSADRLKRNQKRLNNVEGKPHGGYLMDLDRQKILRAPNTKACNAALHAVARNARLLERRLWSRHRSREMIPYEICERCMVII
ncbi:hypothetical protein PRZ48_007100 [Zasmidium cellare]|uniref:Uncharacterized protein n=1 Tax=Zasmidium cellare TaxID=395010 RepID=A0ABR0EKH9_ZASCE|nr:hypothetical protein PRZ48_007100 [Zasmidium cellare]